MSPYFFAKFANAKCGKTVISKMTAEEVYNYSLIWAKEYDEELVEEILSEIEEISNIMIRGGIKKVESENREVTTRSVEIAMRRLALTTVKYYMQGVFNKTF